MAKIGGQNEDGAEEVPYDARYATAAEVDGLRRTLDSFMKKQEEHNDSMALNLDQIMSYMTKVAAKVGVQAIEDKGSNVKGTEASAALAQNPHQYTKVVDAQLHKSTHIPNDTTLAQKHIYVPPPVGNVYYYDPEELDWMHRKPPTPVYHQQEHWSTQGQYFHDIEYFWGDCPWTPQQIEAFNPFPTHPPIQNHQPQNFHNPNHKQQPPIPPARQPTPHSYHQQNNFTNQLQFQHRMVAKGPKLSFPEFDGADPDGWIRKAEKYFELVGVHNEERVLLAVLYIKGKAEFWWRGTGCKPADVPWHRFCRMVTDRFTDTSTYEAVGQFHTLKQVGSVTEYIEKFEELMGLVKRDNPSLRDEYFTLSFVAGLKEPIQHQLFTCSYINCLCLMHGQALNNLHLLVLS